ncbi:MAG: tripartite tricarboxylate transporter substrate-binding protein [Gammaproteobacteria bacterium]|nr:tripartite tricarboxylate transporter substrate-binding protein [Gammaproteobacteria bacterium]
MFYRFIKTGIVIATLAASITVTNATEWSPSGPIKLMIAFRAGGGVDTQARLIAGDLQERHGWKIIPENLAGKGGAIMARTLKAEPADGLTIGMTVTEAITYSSIASRNAGYSVDDFTMLTTTTGSQMGLFAKTSRGWKTLPDLIAAIKGGQKITLGAMSPRLADGAYILARENGIDFTTVMVKGGKGALNGVLADDLDVGWGAGPQNKSVLAGDLVNLVSGESKPLKVSPDAPLLADFGVPYIMGAKFMFVAPAGLPEDARKVLTDAIIEVVSDPNTKVNAMINKAFSGVETISGSDLDKFMATLSAQDQALLDASSE